MTAAVGDLVSAAELIVVAQLGSPWMLERKLGIAHDEVAALLDELQAAGVVGPPTETGIRPPQFTSVELDQALAAVRKHASRQQLVIDSEALDEAHGGDVVLRGGLGVAEVHAAEVSAWADAEVELDDEEPEPPHLVGRPIERPPDGPTTPPAAEQPKEVGRRVLRLIVTTHQGYVSGVKRAYRAATHGDEREHVRLARRSGDVAASAVARAELKAAKKIRTDLLRDLPESVGSVVKVAAWAGAALLAALIVGGVAVFFDPGGITWTSWWAGVGTALDVAGWVIRWASWLALWGALPLLAHISYREGQRVGQPPMWLLPPDEREAVDTEITPSKVIIALRDLGLVALRNAIREAADGAGQMLSPIVSSGCGDQVDVLLCRGVEVADLKKRRAKLAGGLDRHPHELFITVAPTPRTARLWIAWSGALDEPVDPSPLVLDPSIGADLQNGRCPWGVNLRGDTVGVSLYQRHVTVMGLSNQGKTAALRALALWAALDPNVDLHIADLKGVGDWSMFDGLAADLIEGPTDAHVVAATEMLERGVVEMERRMTEGKDAKRRRDIYIVDEAQVAYMCPEKDEQGRPYGGTKATARYLRAVRQIHNQGRVVDELLWQGAQDPTDSNFPKIAREGAHIRASLVVGTESQSRMALGEAAVDRGAAPHELRPDLDKGMLVVHGGVKLEPGQAAETVRTHFIDDDDAAVIAERAKVIRRRKRRRGAPAPQSPAIVDHLARVEAALRGEARVLTSVVFARLIEDDPAEYERRDLTWLSQLLDEEGAPKQKGGDGRIYVVAKRVRQALENPVRGAG